MKCNILIDVIKKCLQRMNRNVIKDGVYGTIRFDGKTFSNLVCNRNKAPTNPLIVVVLESPHKQEFLPSKMYPLVNDRWFKDHLANVINGCKWRQSLQSPLFPMGDYDVYLMNAIQYQCSLGVDTERYRDIVFLTLWGFFRKRFERRLKKLCSGYAKRGGISLIMNSVTKGSHKLIRSCGMPSCANIKGSNVNQSFLTQIGSIYARKKVNSLNDIVQLSINRVYKKLKKMPPNQPYLVKGCHPSSWYFLKNRRAAEL